MGMYLFLRGFLQLAVPVGRGGTLFEACRANRLVLRRVRLCKKRGELRFFLTRADAKILMPLLLDRHVDVRLCGTGGIPVLLARACHRPGLVAGALCALLLLGVSRAVVWQIEVEGNERLSRETVVESLAGAGVRVGGIIYGIDPDTVAAALRRECPDIGYAAVNLRGTVVSVQIKETEPVPVEKPKAPANLVASCDGVVTLPLVFKGRCVVAAGEVVRRGQVLATGLLESENNGYRVTRAAGEVMARTTHAYTVTVPFSYEEKEYTGVEKSLLTLNFFGKEQNLFKNSGNDNLNCDIIEKNGLVLTLMGRQLPLGISARRLCEYRTVSRTRTAEEALALAHDMLRADMMADGAGRTVLEKRIETVVCEDGITLHCTLLCEENIATVAEFSFGS